MAAVGHSGRTLCQISAPAVVLDDKLPGRRSALFRAALKKRWEHEQSLPVTHINVFGPLTRALKCLSQGGTLAVAVDGGHGGNLASVPFLGRRVRLSTGALELAAHFHCPVLPVFVIRSRTGHNTLVIEPPLRAPTDDALSRKDAAVALLHAYVPRLERRVRQHPCHYLRFLAFRELMKRLRPFLGLLAALLLWEVAALTAGTRALPTPAVVAQALVGLIQSATLPRALGLTLGHTALGLGAALGCGIPLGLWMGRSQGVRTLLTPIMDIGVFIPEIIRQKRVAADHGPEFPGQTAKLSEITQLAMNKARIGGVRQKNRVVDVQNDLRLKGKKELFEQRRTQGKEFPTDPYRVVVPGMMRGSGPSATRIS